ncbi:precursor of CEP5-like [Rhodamnia argentea]|uniref:Precursor of CEP5-like n=1 Tax=Rhodamnia argentea TaxID=178133 RepID=A0A8B8PVP3_9MYRT|nr:precursor of CEP5-like [Rhodamnia argentea]
MAQNKVLFAFVFLLLAFSPKLQSTQARQLKLTTQKQHPFSNKLQNVHELLEKEPRKTITEQSKNLHGEILNKATNTDISATQLPPPPSAMVVGTTLPPTPDHSLDDFRPTDPGHSPGVGHPLQN